MTVVVDEHQHEGYLCLKRTNGNLKLYHIIDPPNSNLTSTIVQQSVYNRLNLRKLNFVDSGRAEGEATLGASHRSSRYIRYIPPPPPVPYSSFTPPTMSVTITVDPAHAIAPVDDRIYSGFIEHLGRCKYFGLRLDRL